jgi:hypothetical protein
MSIINEWDIYKRALENSLWERAKGDPQEDLDEAYKQAQAQLKKEEERFNAALDETNQKHGPTLKGLAEHDNE